MPMLVTTLTSDRAYLAISACLRTVRMDCPEGTVPSNDKGLLLRTHFMQNKYEL